MQGYRHSNGLLPIGRIGFLRRCWMTNKRYDSGMEIFVCEGSISDGSGDYPAGSWLRYPVQSKVRISSPQGARVYMKQGAFPN